MKLNISITPNKTILSLTIIITVTVGIMTLNIATFSITTLDRPTHRLTTLNIVTDAP